MQNLLDLKWYKDGVEIPGETGTTSVSDTGIYMYRESWTDFFTTELLPVINSYYRC